MEVTILIKGSEKKRVYHGVDLIHDCGDSIHIHGFNGCVYSRTWRKDNIVYIDVLFFA